ncbi:MAG: RagB/SusD family nutrient uptake outer membrane protein [Bacteroidales bacterium]
MKISHKIKQLLLAALIASTSTGCSFLDVSDQLAAEMNMEEVFSNTSYTRRFHRYIYSGIPNMTHIILDTGSGGNLTGLDNPWPAIGDELKNAQGNTKNVASVGYHAGNASYTRWSLYKQIRQANLFLENARPIPPSGDTDFISEEEMALLKNEARFLRAYYHYLLFELYGSAPIMDKSVSPNDSDLDFYRASVDEMIAFIDTELNACMDLLPETEPKERAAAPTKSAALSILAKLHVYAASPLFNGGYYEALQLRDNTGKQLFPNNDPSKWEKAKTALERLLSYCEGKHELYIVRDDKNEIDPEESLYQLFQIAEENPEVLWATSKNMWGSVNGDGRERRCTPRGVYQGFSCVGVTQEMVDAFYMSDGKTIIESSLYNEDGVAADGIPNMYKGREPRFYQAITYAGKIWQKTSTKIFFHKGQTEDNSKADNCYTGTLLYKGMNKTLLNQGSNPKSQYRPSIIFRLADFYLLYAEVLNELNPSDPRIIEYIDKVRIRAGIAPLSTIKPELRGDKELQKLAILHERKIELFVEGQRYFDVRRLMIAEKPEGRQSGDFHGMNMNGNNLEEFMNRTVFERRIFEKRMYLYPLPLGEIQKSKKLVQNPGW